MRRVAEDCRRDWLWGGAEHFAGANSGGGGGFVRSGGAWRSAAHGVCGPLCWRILEGGGSLRLGRDGVRRGAMQTLLVGMGCGGVLGLLPGFVA